MKGLVRGKREEREKGRSCVTEMGREKRMCVL